MPHTPESISGLERDNATLRRQVEAADVLAAVVGASVDSLGEAANPMRYALQAYRNVAALTPPQTEETP